jgi:hypothetical protein
VYSSHQKLEEIPLPSQPRLYRPLEEAVEEKVSRTWSGKNWEISMEISERNHENLWRFTMGIYGNLWESMGIMNIMIFWEYVYLNQQK